MQTCNYDKLNKMFWILEIIVKKLEYTKFVQPTQDKIKVPSVFSSWFISYSYIKLLGPVLFTV